jgi:uncharacterized protein (TIGR02453 family)
VPAYFSKELFKFLSQLKEHNDRAWFASNKERYEQFVREPLQDFISDAGPHLRKISPNIVSDPRPVGGSLFRIHRDVRFSKDKSPYKTHAGVHFSHRSGKDAHSPGFYLHLEPGSCFIAGGMWMPETKPLRMIRAAIANRSSEWKKVRAIADSSERLVRPPQGFDAKHPLIDDIKRKSFTGSIRLTEAQVCGDGFMARFIEGCKSISPLMKFLASAVGAAW